MSEQAAEGQEPIVDSQGSEVMDLPVHGDVAFGALMDALAPEDDGGGSAGAAGSDGAAGGAATGAPAAAGGAAEGGEGAAGAAGGGQAAGEQAAPADAAAAGAGTGDGAAAGTGDAGAGGADAGPDAGDRPADWTQPAAELVPRFGELSTAFEESVSRSYQEAALAEVKEEHAPYFEALEKHPRMLVGQHVPAIGREGTELLRDSNDAREWQEAVKAILVDEVRGRAAKTMEENSGFLSTVHQSIELFQNNTDLIPGTKEFDVELANRFAEFASPYELRVEGKLQGYSIPVQPLVERIRDQLSKERAAKASAPAETGTTGKPAASATGAPAASASTGSPAQTQSKPPEPPQAGIPSKAGNSESSEDFSTLFGTIGLPNLQI